MLVTDLLNYGMPMIRYRIGDIGALSDRVCDCGRGLPLMEMLGGRIADFLVTPAGRMVSAVYLAVGVLAKRPGLAQVQFVQETRDHVLVRAVPSPGFVPEDLDFVNHNLAELMGPGVTFSHELVKRYPGGRGASTTCVSARCPPSGRKAPAASRPKPVPGPAALGLRADSRPGRRPPSPGRAAAFTQGPSIHPRPIQPPSPQHLAPTARAALECP